MKDNVTMKGNYYFKKYARFNNSVMRSINKNLARISTRLHILFLDRFGTVIEQSSTPNLIVNAGKAQIALLFGDATATPFTYIGLGTSNTATAAAQTALGAEISTNGLSRAAATVDRTTTTVTNDTARLIKTFVASGGAHPVEEIGIFNASSSGTMFSRALSTKSIADGESLLCTYTVAFA
jgi:hypothetical protein